MKVRYDSYCGLNCGACLVGRANELNDTATLERYADEWGTTVEGLKCTGCKTAKISEYCVSCEMRECARGKKLEFCFQCADYPCEDISKLRNDKASHHSVVFNNLNKIKKDGLSEWLRAEKARWSCTKCGTTFTWYTECCEKCGEKLYNSIDEEKDLTI